MTRAARALPPSAAAIARAVTIAPVRAFPRAIAVVVAVVVAIAAAIASTGCAARILDLGTNDAGTLLGPDTTPPPDASASSGYGCVVVPDDQLRLLAGTTCPATCADPAGAPYALASQLELVAATLGQWIYCGPPAFGPPDAVGLELTPGCRIFYLRRDASGAVVRGTEAAYQVRFDIDGIASAASPRRIEIELDDTTHLALDVRVSACPNRLFLTAESGVVTALATDPAAFGDAGRPDPIK